MSGGEARRAALATALVSDPTVILLDEPTAGLDPGQRSQFYSILTALDASATVLMSTHLLEDVLGAADVVWIVGKGRVVRGPEIQSCDGPQTTRLSLTELQEQIAQFFDPSPR